MTASKSHDIIQKLRSEILHMQGFTPFASRAGDAGLGSISECFPKGVFPLAAVHEFLVDCPENEAASGGFVTGILSNLMESHSAIVWINREASLFPPSLKTFGVQPDRFIFIQVPTEKEIPWVMEEALKCPALTAVVAEVEDLSFIASRRLQLAVEQSLVTGFILRKSHHKVGTTACVSRWRISPLQSKPLDDLPGVGLPAWKVELLRMRNGKPGVWSVVWKDRRFESLSENETIQEQERKAG